jgi:hypothetical protein
MTWDGIERREENSKLGFCSAHIELIEDMAVIKTTLLNIEKNMKEGMSFRTGLVLTMIGVVVTIFIQVAAFAYYIGIMSKQIEVNTRRLNMVEEELSPEQFIRRVKAIRLEK